LIGGVTVSKAGSEYLGFLEFVGKFQIS